MDMCGPSQEVIRERDAQVGRSKSWRVALDSILQEIKCNDRKSRERSLAITKIQEAIMWLGMDLKDINDGLSCYPEGYNPASPVVNPVSDGLKL